MEKVEAFLAPFEVLAFHDPCARTYAEIRADLEGRGLIIGPNDLIIASIATAHEGVLVTNNIGEFQRIEGLRFENCIAE